ncbi:uncharacterized protein LOC107261063 [Ricinus communis]|uniref:uncharacterized protein LOC107261063 n=1 Tax=Ricinus communis TaxID=3988 RepID=UPI000772520C|nr:uncharacterized protein LOC107261063 [Ricinus communis]|eukprot:XP_015573192.1 uncharacterized protein LOC107261063 [Ricinus communis]
MTLTWDDFLSEFANKYTPPMYRDQKKMELLSLEQGYMTVSKYEMQFSRLSKYALEEVGTKDAKQRRFEKGLRMDIREKISLKPPSYSTLLEVALRVEECLIEKDAMTAKKRKMINEYEVDEVVTARVGQRVREVREVFQLVEDIVHHVLDVIGFTVDSVGDQGRYFVFIMEAPSATDIVTGKISIYGFDAYTLFDPRSTCSFISYEFALKSHNDIETLGYNICVSMPTGGTVIVDKVVKTCLVIINGNTLYANLVVIKLKEFDVILGMDWLSKNHAIVDCHPKEVVIETS